MLLKNSRLRHPILRCQLDRPEFDRSLWCFFTECFVCAVVQTPVVRFVKVLLWICCSVSFIGPILWGHSGPLCHALSLLLLLWTSILHCHSPGVATVAHRLCYSYSWLRLILVVVSTVATPGEWQCKISTGGVRRLAVANGPNIFQMLLVYLLNNKRANRRLTMLYI